MATKPVATVHQLPSSILHNSGAIRSQYTRKASRHMVQAIARKFRSWNKRAVAVATDMGQVQGGH
ncbi:MULTISPECIES: hypothetical protein [unclassified Marinobacter]|uniref:hypothetical protein n=1 Tax=unclassified Marinobacter TaxID=83889 RepID=UPI000BF9D8B4|nr:MULTISPECIES: hypothetical protein [unclassified Marinobacter]PFG09645.1 hypothetical protein ATI45_2029 [Marinobacter sp. LV10MA510-1]PFG51569.1 hypothetical protein ATG98_0521 [Marinobacter sp. LV10R520-4]